MTIVYRDISSRPGVAERVSSVLIGDAGLLVLLPRWTRNLKAGRAARAIRCTVVLSILATLGQVQATVAQDTVALPPAESVPRHSIGEVSKLPPPRFTPRQKTSVVKPFRTPNPGQLQQWKNGQAPELATSGKDLSEGFAK